MGCSWGLSGNFSFPKDHMRFAHLIQIFMYFSGKQSQSLKICQIFTDLEVCLLEAELYEI